MNNSTKMIQLGFLSDKCSTTMKPLDAELFRQLTRCQLTTDIMTRIEHEPDEEAKTQLKGNLMAALYACQMPEDGQRPTKETARPSGLCLHDFDHMTQDVRTYYQQHLAGHEQQLGIMLAHITPRGKGLRLVTRMQPGEQYTHCQQRVAEQTGLTQFADAAVKDITRLSFIPSEAYLLYLNEEMFALPAADLSVVQPATQPATQPAAQPAAAQPVLSATEPANAVMADTSMAEAQEFEGVKFSTIINELLNRLATDGQPRTGERNMDLYALVRELRHCTKYNFQWTYLLVAPYFSELPDQEIRRTINSAINSTGRIMTPTMRGILDQLKTEQSEASLECELDYPSLPELPPVLDSILQLYHNRAIHKQAVLASLPIFGISSTHVRFRYLDNRVNSTSFMTAVVGKSGRGKAFAEHLFRTLTPMFQTWDKEERTKEYEYNRKLRLRKEGEDYPDDPQPKIRLFSDDITTNRLLENLYNLDGEHGLQFTEEVARLVKSSRSHYNDNDDLYRKAFDNGLGGKESMSALTRNIKIPIYLNTLFCGTYPDMHKMYNDAAGGLNNRVIFALLPSLRNKGVPRYEDPSPELRKAIDKVLTDLWMAGTREEEEGQQVTDLREVHQGQQEMQFPFLDEAMSGWIAKCDEEDDENPNETWRDLANRAAVTGYRAGVVAWLLWGRPQDEKTLKHVQNFAIWVADCARIGVYNFCGLEYDRLNEAHNNQPKVRNTKNKKLFSLLPEEFTVNDIISLRLKNGDSTDVKMIVSRWVADGLITKTGVKTFTKMKRIA